MTEIFNFLSFDGKKKMKERKRVIEISKSSIWKLKTSIVLYHYSGYKITLFFLSIYDFRSKLDKTQVDEKR